MQCPVMVTVHNVIVPEMVQEFVAESNVRWMVLTIVRQSFRMAIVVL